MDKSIVDRALAESFVALCEEKGVASVTVREVAAACGVSKQTFYNHFRDKQDLMNYLFERDVALAVGSFGQGDLGMAAAEEVAARILGRMRSMKGYYTAIAAYQVQNGFSDSFTGVSRDFFVRALEERGHDPHEPHASRLIEFNCAGLNRLTFDWISAGMKAHPRAFAAELMRFVSPELRDLMGP